MKATELIGKRAIRTAPIIETREGMLFEPARQVKSYGFCDSPIEIVHATDSHIVYFRKSMLNDDIQRSILDSRYCDDSWTDFDELVQGIPETKEVNDGI